MLSPEELVAKANCAACGICAERGGSILAITGFGDINAEIVILGEAPGAQEERFGRPFVGQSGQLLDQILSAVGVPRGTVYTTNANLCRPPGNRTPTWKEIQACQGRLAVEIRSLPNRKVIVAMGTTAIKTLFGPEASVQKNGFGTIWSKALGCFIIPAFHPAVLFHQDDTFLDIVWALQKAKEACGWEPGKVPRPVVLHEVLDTVEKQIETFTRYLTYEGIASCDIEADGTNFQEHGILSIGFEFGDDIARILPVISPDLPPRIFDPEWDKPLDPRVAALLIQLFESPKIKWLWHNGKFDIQYIISQLKIMARVDEDSMLMHFSMDERGGGKDEEDSDSGSDKRGAGAHGLKILARKYLNSGEWEKEIKQYVPTKATPYSAIPRLLLYKYNAHDVIYTKYLRLKLLKELSEEEPSELFTQGPLDCYYKILVPASNNYAQAEMRGVDIDLQYLAHLHKTMEEALNIHEKALIEDACSIMGISSTPQPKLTKTGRVSQAKGAMKPPFNVRSPQQVAGVLFDHLKLPTGKSKKRTDGARATGKNVLELFRNAHPFVSSLHSYRSEERLFSTYIEGFEKRLSKVDGRIHADFLLHGTKTGRLAGKDPNLMNIPRESEIKMMFVAPEGYTFIAADYAQLEVRVAAFLSGDEKLIAACLAGDLHMAVCERVFAKQLRETRAAQTIQDLERILNAYDVLRDVRLKHHREPWTDVEALRKVTIKALRHNTKYVTFGILYGREARSLAEGELKCTPAEAQQYIDAFFKEFSKVHAWIKLQHTHATYRGWLETPSGRRRRFPFLTQQNRWQILKMASNFPIQSYASDICLRAFIILEEQIRLRGWGHALFTVHDNINFIIKKEFRDVAIPYIRDVMENTTSGGDITYAVDIDEGERWGAAKKVA